MSVPDAPPRPLCACGNPAAYWDGAPGAAICGACWAKRSITLTLSLALAIHEGHVWPTRLCVVCNRRLPR